MRALLLTPLLLIAGCATMRGEPGPVALEQAQLVGPYVVTPLNVVADNRCFENARCSDPGNVIVRAQIDGDGWSGWDDGTARNFTLGHPAEVGRGRYIVLDSVTPERNAGTILSVAPYRFHFSVVD